MSTITLEPSKAIWRRATISCNGGDVSIGVYAPGSSCRSLAWLGAPLANCRIARPDSFVKGDVWTLWLGRSALDLTESEATKVAAELGLPIPQP